MSGPWARDKKAPPMVSAPPAVAPPTAMPGLPPVTPSAPESTGLPATGGASGALHFPPGGPAFAAAVGSTDTAPPSKGTTPSETHDAALASANTQANAPEGDERFAFFAAFREASERAREEAGIDDRRGSQ